MIISTEKPPCFDRLAKAFPIGHLWGRGLIITYNGVAHCAEGWMPKDLEVHEQVHIEQQKGWDPDQWMERYLTDLEFRFETEYEAYKAQADYLRKTIKDRNQLHRKLLWIWRCMADHYGGMISFQKARSII